MREREKKREKQKELSTRPIYSNISISSGQSSWRDWFVDPQQTWSDHSTSFLCVSPMRFERTLHYFSCSIKTYVHIRLRANTRWRLPTDPISYALTLLLLQRHFTISKRKSQSCPDMILLCYMKTRINIQRQSSTVTTLHDGKLASRLQEAMLTCFYLVVLLLRECVFIALRLL